MPNYDELKELQSLLDEILGVDRPAIYDQEIFQEESL